MATSDKPDEIILYGDRPLSSPYVFSVFVALEEKKLPFDCQLLDLNAGEHRKPPYATASITNRVPALRHGDFWVAESSAITEYLDEAFPAPAHTALYPAEPRARAKVRMVQALVRSDFMPVREERSTDTVFHGAPVAPFTPAGVASAERLVRIATAVLAEHRTGVAAQFSIADADLALLLQRLIANGDPVPAALGDFARAVWARPSVAKWLARAAG